MYVYMYVCVCVYISEGGLLCQSYNLTVKSQFHIMKKLDIIGSLILSNEIFKNDYQDKAVHLFVKCLNPSSAK